MACDRRSARRPGGPPARGRPDPPAGRHHRPDARRGHAPGVRSPGPSAARHVAGAGPVGPRPRQPRTSRRSTAPTRTLRARIVELAAGTGTRASTGPTSRSCSRSARASPSRCGRSAGSSTSTGERSPAAPGARATGADGSGPSARASCCRRMAASTAGSARSIPSRRSWAPSTTPRAGSPAPPSGPQEDAAGYLEVLTQTSRRPGLPWTFYTDRHGIFDRDHATTPDAPRAARRRARPDPGGPGAAGRGHRLAARLVTRGEGPGRAPVGHPPGPPGHRAAPGGHHDHRRGQRVPARLARPPQRAVRGARGRSAPAWRPWPEGLSAEAVFAFWYRRTVARDSTLAWDGRALALPRRSDGRSRAGREVTVAERLDGSLWAELEGTWQPLADAPPSAPELRARKARRAGATGITPADVDPSRTLAATHGTRTRTPAADHPWRRPSKPR